MTHTHSFRFHYLVFIFALCCFFSNAQQTRDLKKEQGFEEKLRLIDPTLPARFKEATTAMDAGNYTLAATAYGEVNAKAPQFTPALRRLGMCKFYSSEETAGIELCEKAVALERNSDNMITLAQLYLQKKSKSVEETRRNSTTAIDLLIEGRSLEGAVDSDYLSLLAQTYLQRENQEQFTLHTNELLLKYPDLLASQYYGALLAANSEEWIQAEDHILAAQSLGLSPEVVQNFRNSVIGNQAMFSRSKMWFLYLIITWLAGFGILYLLGVVLSNYTLRTIEKKPATEKLNAVSLTLRKFYAFLINSAGVYYYFSLPVLTVIIVATVGGLFYLFWVAGHIPIKLAVLLLIGGVITIYGMIRSLLTKVQTVEPGEILKKEDAPALYALTTEVANTMGTRPIDMIRITSEADLAVYENGNWKDKLQDKSHRVLILGTGVLKDFKLNDFRAVLAHEYGHFSNRDTAGGAVAMRVRNDLHKFYNALVVEGQASAWNVGFQFIRLYDFIFRRISNGATRLQEVMADRVAAETYGAQAFQNGLTYVVKRNIEFVHLAHAEITDARNTKRAFNNLYELVPADSKTIDEEVQQSLNRKTTQDDTHPSPVDRFRYIKGLGDNKQPDNDTYVRDLFNDWAALTQHHTKVIEKSWEGQ